MNIIINLLLFFYIINVNNTNSIFLHILSIDNIAFALDFIINLIKTKQIFKREHYQNIVILNNNLYKGKLIERYVYYILITFLYWLIYLFVIQNNIIRYIIFITIIPCVFNTIYDTYEKYFKLISEYKDYIIKIFLAEQVSNIIKFLSKKYIDDVNVDKEHIKITLLETNTIIDEIYSFIKNFLIVLLMMYFRSKSILYYKIVKYIYIYNSGNYYINNIDLTSCKNNLKQIIEDKNYKKFNEPMIIQSMLYLYYSKKDNQFDLYINKFNYGIIEYFTLWTLGSFL